MMRKISKFIKKYYLSIIVAIIILIVGIIGMIFLFGITKGKTALRDFKNDDCKFRYDSTWKVVDEKDKKIILKHNSKSEVEIEVVDLEDEYRYVEIDEIFDELLYDISSQNEEFSLLSTKETRVTRNRYAGYKLLYENNDSGAMLVIGKSGDKLVMFTYKAGNDYFDILLDSVQNIIYNFELIDNSYTLTYKIDVPTSKIEWGTNKEITSSLKENIEYEFASAHYLVNFMVPSNFRQTSLDSTWIHASFNGLKDGTVYLTATVNNENIYEEFDSSRDYRTIFYQYKGYKDGTYGYDYNEIVEEMEDGNGYIYKVNYKTKVELGDLSNEHLHDIVHLVYEIDASHILTIEVEGYDQVIPKELIDRIKINSYTNYSSYVENKTNENYLIGELKRFTDYNKDKLELITLNIPKRFKEDDKTQNVYATRYYNYNYDEERNISEYEVSYNTMYTLESGIESINSDYEIKKGYGSYQLLTYVKDVNINNKTFKLYEGGYTSLDDALLSSVGRVKYYANTKVLFYDLGDGKCLTIHIKGIDREISDSLLGELTNFDIKIKEY